jgi:hypothetical protein
MSIRASRILPTKLVSNNFGLFIGYFLPPGWKEGGGRWEIVAAEVLVAFQAESSKFGAAVVKNKVIRTIELVLPDRITLKVRRH